jgi:hypothetical protein
MKHLYYLLIIPFILLLSVNLPNSEEPPNKWDESFFDAIRPYENVFGEHDWVQIPPSERIIGWDYPAIFIRLKYNENGWYVAGLYFYRKPADPDYRRKLLLELAEEIQREYERKQKIFKPDFLEEPKDIGS